MSLRTLVLTPWMARHRIAGWQDGVVLAVTGKGEVLESYEAVCASPSVSLQIPAVVRLTKEIHATKRGVKFSRTNIYARDGHRCCYCGLRFHPRDLNYDHVIPRSRGGKTDWDNIVTSCKRCNVHKDNRTPAQAGMRMHFQPFRPRVLPMTSPVVIDIETAPAEWRLYLGDQAAAVRIG
jgi:5-methylcytosine-specific restriction endonuclease McrA